jgi:hypothetical protein
MGGPSMPSDDSPSDLSDEDEAEVEVEAEAEAERKPRTDK